MTQTASADPGSTPETHYPDPLRGLFGDPIYIYTRQQAIGDGVLVDVSDWACAGSNASVAMAGHRV